MKLIKARIRGLGKTIESSWFDPAPGCNLFSFSDSETGHYFLRALETINPTYHCDALQPFSHFPETIEKNGRTRRIHPAKRTVAIAVFDSPPDLVGELAQASPLLYETDRIEIGRRLDYSRWSNFVELASSTRLSEIEDNLQKLQHLLETGYPENNRHLSRLLQDHAPSDRVKESLKDRLEQWLQNLPDATHDNHHELVSETLAAVRRIDYFREARKVVDRRLPLFYMVGDKESRKALLHLCRQEKTAEDNIDDMITRLQHTDDLSLERLQLEADLVRACSTALGRPEPVLLFVLGSRGLALKKKQSPLELITTLADQCQCLCSCQADLDLGRQVSAKRFTQRELENKKT